MRSEIKIRNAKPEEFQIIGDLLVSVYASLEGFPKPNEQPKYYEFLANVGELTKNSQIEILVATTNEEIITGAVVYFSDMQFYGSGGTATQEKNSAGFRLLGVNNQFRGKGIGKLLSIACIEKAKSQNQKQLIIHTTNAMKPAWKMYENLGFKRSIDLDFLQGDLEVFGFRYLF